MSDAVMLPLSLLGKNVYDIKPLQHGYVKPCAMWVDKNMRCWLMEDMEVIANEKLMYDKDNILLLRDENGYHVIVHPETTYRWHISQLTEPIELDCEDDMDLIDMNEMRMFHEENPALDIPVASIKIDSVIWEGLLPNSTQIN